MRKSLVRKNSLYITGLASQKTFIPVQRRYKIKSYKNKEVEGFDTETLDGYAKIAATSKTWKKIKNFEDVLGLLTYKPHRKTLNVFYNLAFDFEVLFKYEPEIFLQLLKDKKALYKGYRFYYLPKKLLSIRDKNRNTYRFFDIAQFWGGSLEKNVKDNFGHDISEKKRSRADLFKKFSTEEIGEYCRQDAYWTRLLTERFLHDLSCVNLFPNKLISCGNLSAMYCQANADIPVFRDVPRRVQEFYWRAFRGGWFDTYKKGFFTGSKYDLNSAYPCAIAQIPDVRKGRWIAGIRENSSIGVVKCEINDSLHDFSPIGIFSHGLRFYPCFDESVIVYMTLAEYLEFEKPLKLKILSAYTFIKEGHSRPPYNSVTSALYGQRLFHKKNTAANHVIKIILNSLYGKTCEKVFNGSGFIAGTFFAPLFACETTATTRLQLYKTFNKHQRHIISVLTDAVITDKRLPISSSLGLGEFKLEMDSQKLLMLGSGVYQFDGEPAHARGFSKKYNLFDLCQTDKTVIDVPVFRPTHWKEAVVQKRIKDIGVFSEHEYKIDLNSHSKRIWRYNVKNGFELLEKQFDSTPVPLSCL